MAFSSGLVFMAVDNLFGGDGRFPTKAERKLISTEQRVIHRMLTMARERRMSLPGALFIKLRRNTSGFRDTGEILPILPLHQTMLLSPRLSPWKSARIAGRVQYLYSLQHDRASP